MVAVTPTGAPDSGDGDSLVGIVLEQRYEMVRKIGQGGMARSYEATHRALGSAWR